MKKTNIFVAVALVAGLSSCSHTPKAQLETQLDSLSYSLGIASANGLDGYLTRLGLDSTYVVDFLRGVNEGASLTSKKDIAYQAGAAIGQNILNNMIPNVNRELFMTDTTKTISKENLLAGFAEGALTKRGDMKFDEAQIYVNTTMDKVKEQSMEVMYADYKAENEKFLAENKTKEGVQTTPSGLQYKILVKGNGAVPTKDSRVELHYKGMLIDSTEFDNSYKRQKPTTLLVNRFVKGFSEALTMMPVGSKWQLFIPQELAYGAKLQGNIKPFSTLIFEVELLNILPDNKKK